jgi:hypothetical protein
MVGLRTAAMVTLAAACVAIAPVADARESYPTHHVGGWEVYGWNTECWMAKTFPDGTRFLYSWDTKDLSSYLLLKNKNWTTVKEGGKYYTNILIGDWSFFETAKGHVQDDGAYAVGFFADDPFRFRSALATEKSLEFVIGGPLRGNFNLTGSPRAVKEVIRCANAIITKPLDSSVGQ